MGERRQAPDGAANAIPAQWVDRLIGATFDLPLAAGERAVAEAVLETIAAIVPSHAVGLCLVAEGRSGGQIVLRRAPAPPPGGGAAAQPESIDPVRLFPSFRHEHVTPVSVSDLDGTLHLASREGSLDGTPAVLLLERAAVVLRHALPLARKGGPSVRGAPAEDSITQRMMRADKLATFGQLAAGVVHELNNPLTSIVAYSDYLVRKASSGGLTDPEDIDRLGRIHESANRMLRFTRDLVAYARPPRRTSQELVIVHAVVDQAIAFCEHLLGESRVEVERRYAEDVRTIRGSSEQLVQVFVNLLTNAVQASRTGGGRVVVTTSRGPGTDRITVSVEDDGSGISAEHLPHVFTPFFTTKSEEQGTGLGLSIVKNIVQSHEGAIRAESPAGRGARFVIELPG